MGVGQSAGMGSQPMEPRDFIRLAALGTAAREAATVEGIWAVIEDIAAPLWVPVTEVVASCVDEMVDGGLLREIGRGWMETTESGREHLSSLFARPSGRPGCSLGQVGHRLKLAFADLARPDERRHYLSLAIRAYEGELAECERRCQQCLARGTLGRRWLDHETDRLRHDLSVLQGMAAQCGGSSHPTLS